MLQGWRSWGDGDAVGGGLDCASQAFGFCAPFSLCCRLLEPPSLCFVRELRVRRAMAKPWVLGLCLGDCQCLSNVLTSGSQGLVPGCWHPACAGFFERVKATHVWAFVQEILVLEWRG